MKRAGIAAAALAWLTLATASPATAAPAAGATALRDHRLLDAAKRVMVTEPARALTLAQRIERTGTDPLVAAEAEWLEGEALSRLKRTDEARRVLDHVADTIRRIAPGGAINGEILLSQGWMAESSGDIASAFKDFERAHTIFSHVGDARGQAKALQNIAGIYQDAGDNARALRYYSQAIDVYRGDTTFLVAAHNNVGESLRLLGRYRAAEREYEKALGLLGNQASLALRIDILTNLAWARVLAGNLDAASADAMRVLALTKHPETAAERPYAYGLLAMVAARRRAFPQAAALMDRTFADADLATTDLSFLSFHQAAADIYAQAGRPDMAYRHLLAYNRLNDGVRALAASTNSALMAARFDFSSQDLRISQLQANRARLHEMFLLLVAAAVSVIAALMSAGVVSLRRSRNRERLANGQLSQANTSLEKALKVKSDFLAMTSHEIRTPLNGILGMTQVLLAERGVAEPLRGKLSVIHGAGETMRMLVDDILDLSKIEAGGLAVARGPVRLPQLLAELAELWRGRASAKGLDLALDLANCPPLIEEDGDRLRQVLANLLGNAVKFTEAGSVRLAARVAEADGDALLILSVADTGIGIAPDQQELVFEKFAQADTSISRRYGGTGLGLAICRAVAIALSGRLELQSAPGAGSIFTLSLPLRRLDPASDPSPPLVAAGDAPAAMLLEPNRLNQRVIAKLLAAPLGEIRCVDTLDALLAQLAEGPCPLVIVQATALEGAGESAADALNRLAEAAGHGARLLVIADERESAALGAVPDVELLAKPISGVQLVQAAIGPAARLPAAA